MNRHARKPYGIVPWALVLLFGQISLSGQATEVNASPPPLDLKVDLVLSPEFCGTVRKSGILETFRVGRYACEQFPAALQDIFGDLRRIGEQAGSDARRARLTLTPRFVNVSVTDQPMLPTSRRQLLVTLEWTIRNSSGELIWLQTIQASAERKAWTKKISRALVQDAVGELARESVAKMRSASELAKLSQRAGSDSLSPPQH